MEQELVGLTEATEDAEVWDLVDLDDRLSPSLKEFAIFVAGAVLEWVIS